MQVRQPRKEAVQHRITEHLSAAENRINADLKMLDKLGTQKTGLRQAPLTSTIPVKADESQEITP